MPTISFIVNDVPVAQPRQRHAVINGMMRNYVPSDHPVTAFKAYCKWAAKSAYQDPPLNCPISLRLAFIFPRPKNMIWKTKPMPREYKSTKPDWDNLGKSICDALNQLVWIDDSQIVISTVTKQIASGNEQPHVEVLIETL